MDEKYIKTQISFPKDEDGYTGRNCPSCNQYFKINFGTNLPLSSHKCPYCGFKAEVTEFFTSDQTDYMYSVIAKEMVEPEIDKFCKEINKMFKNNSFIKFEAKKHPVNFTIKQYQEKLLETDVICDNCGLDFSIYGVFSNCPYCGQLNAKVIFDKSIEVSNKKLELYKDEELNTFLRSDLIKDALNGGVSAFDSLGKALKTKYTQIIPPRPRNIFQNLNELNNFLQNEFNKSIADYTSESDFKFIYKMFQVRHIYEHSAGQIDDDFIKKIPEYNEFIGRKYILTEEEIIRSLHVIQDLGTKIFYEFEKKENYQLQITEDHAV